MHRSISEEAESSAAGVELSSLLLQVAGTVGMPTVPATSFFWAFVAVRRELSSRRGHTKYSRSHFGHGNFRPFAAVPRNVDQRTQLDDYFFFVLRQSRLAPSAWNTERRCLSLSD